MPEVLLAESEEFRRSMNLREGDVQIVRAMHVGAPSTAFASHPRSMWQRHPAAPAEFIVREMEREHADSRRQRSTGKASEAKPAWVRLYFLEDWNRGHRVEIPAHWRLAEVAVVAKVTPGARRGMGAAPAVVVNLDQTRKRCKGVK